MRTFFILLLLGAGHFLVRAQHQEVCDPPMAYKGKEQAAQDTVSVLSAFKNGRFNGHFRYFLMATDNAGPLTDYAAHAGGGGLRFETASFHGFQFGVGGSYIFNLGSPDFTKPDSITGAFNRYEVGLFDIDNPGKKKDLDRLEELYLRYGWKKSSLTFGRQLINTPFINLQDGRMRPTAVEGMILRLDDIRDVRMEAGFVYAISPRSTVGWYSIEQSFGIYPSGVNPDGTKSAYRGQIRSAGAGYVGITKKFKKAVSLQLWDLWVDQVMNTMLLQADWVRKTEHQSQVMASVQFIRQDGLGGGVPDDAVEGYFPEHGRSMAFGVSAGYQRKKLLASLQYTRITADGRYLMPREWGRDPLLTFMPRERQEGLGDVHALMGKINVKEITRGFSAGVAAGYFNLPDVKNTRLNKYGMPSYAHMNLDLRYAFSGLLEGLDVQYLFVAKINAGETHSNLKYVFNKVDMQLHNVVMNFHF